MDVKQIICVRRDLKMRRGKECAQAAHASMAWLSNRIKSGDELQLGDFTQCRFDNVIFSEEETEWMLGPFTKIVLAADTEDTMMELHKRALLAGLTNVYLITDAGKTEFGGEATRTALALGPEITEKLDELTKHPDFEGRLKLY